MKMKVVVLALFSIALFSCNNDDDVMDDGPPKGTSLMAFITYQDINCGTITVTIDGLGTKTMRSSATPTSFVQCQDTHPSVVQFDSIPQGTYSYVASCSGYTWTGTREIGLGSCSFLGLTVGSAD